MAHEESGGRSGQRYAGRVIMRTSRPVRHCGHKRIAGAGDAEAAGEGSSSTTGLVSSLRHSASFSLRKRLARNPKWRMRRKPGGSVWMRKRRMNSSAETVMMRDLYFALLR